MTETRHRNAEDFRPRNGWCCVRWEAATGKVVATDASLQLPWSGGAVPLKTKLHSLASLAISRPFRIGTWFIFHSVDQTHESQLASIVRSFGLGFALLCTFEIGRYGMFVQQFEGDIVWV